MEYSDMQYMRQVEVSRAAKMRGHCESCGHNWRPRNPCTTVNRCPGCGVRGHVKYETFSDKVGPAQQPEG